MLDAGKAALTECEQTPLQLWPNPLWPRAFPDAKACWEGPELNQQLGCLMKGVSSRGAYNEPRVIPQLLMTLSMFPFSLARSKHIESITFSSSSALLLWLYNMLQLNSEKALWKFSFACVSLLAYSGKLKAEIFIFINPPTLYVEISFVSFFICDVCQKARRMWAPASTTDPELDCQLWKSGRGSQIAGFLSLRFSMTWLCLCSVQSGRKIEGF